MVSMVAGEDVFSDTRAKYKENDTAALTLFLHSEKAPEAKWY